MEKMIAGLTSALLALVGYYIYEWINYRWFKRKDFMKIAHGFQFSDEVSSFLWQRAKKKIRQLITYDRKQEPKFASGLEIVYIKDSLLKEVRANFPSRDYLIFSTHFDKKGQNIGIIKGTDPYLILKTMQTHGENQNLNTAKLISELKSLDKKYPFSISGAGSDWVELYFENLPEDINPIIEKAAALCPYPQGPSEAPLEVSAREEELKTTHKLFLGWPSHQE